MNVNRFIENQLKGYRKTQKELRMYHDGKLTLDEIKAILRQAVAEMPNHYYDEDEEMLRTWTDGLLAEVQEELNQEIDNFENIESHRSSWMSSGSILFSIYQDDAVHFTL